MRSTVVNATWRVSPFHMTSLSPRRTLLGPNGQLSRSVLEHAMIAIDQLKCPALAPPAPTFLTSSSPSFPHPHILGSPQTGELTNTTWPLPSSPLGLPFQLTSANLEPQEGVAIVTLRKVSFLAQEARIHSSHHPSLKAQSRAESRESGGSHPSLLSAWVCAAAPQSFAELSKNLESRPCSSCN